MTFGSILGSYVQRKMKATHSKHNNSEKVKAYYKRLVYRYKFHYILSNPFIKCSELITLSLPRPSSR